TVRSCTSSMGSCVCIIIVVVADVPLMRLQSYLHCASPCRHMFLLPYRMPPWHPRTDCPRCERCHPAGGHRSALLSTPYPIRNFLQKRLVFPVLQYNQPNRTRREVQIQIGSKCPAVRGPPRRMRDRNS